MYTWISQWMDGGIWMYEWTQLVYKLINEWIDTQMDEWIDGWIDISVDKYTDRRMDRHTKQGLFQVYYQYGIPRRETSLHVSYNIMSATSITLGMCFGYLWSLQYYSKV